MAARKTSGKKGRPTEYTPELADMICELLADGQTLKKICRPATMPHDRTVRRWALDPEHPFSPRYTRAREIGYHSMADDVLEYSDAPSTDKGAVARDRLKVETRKWLLSKALPKIYGDKLALTDAEGTGPAVIQVVTGVPRVAA